MTDPMFFKFHKAFKEKKFRSTTAPTRGPRFAPDDFASIFKIDIPLCVVVCLGSDSVFS